MKICTYNVNSIRARIDLLLKWLEKRGSDLDVLCLQELKAPENLFPLEKLKESGYHAAVYGQPRFNGVAVCSKSKPENIGRGLGDSFWDQQKRLISCKVNGVTFINVYAPHGDLRGGEKYHYKLKWYAFFKQYLEANHSPHEPLVVLGDFNVAREDRDVYDAGLLRDSIGTMPEERDALQKILDWGLIDTFRYSNPEKRGYTWWSYLGGGIWKNEGMRLDYVFCTRPLLKDLKDAEVDIWPRRRRKPTPSDHAPLIVTLA